MIAVGHNEYKITGTIQCNIAVGGFFSFFKRTFDERVSEDTLPSPTGLA